MNRRYAIKLGCPMVVSASVLFGTPSLADPRMADLVQAGKVRVALFLPLYTSDPRTGELRRSGPGIVAIEVARGLAAHIGIEALLVGHPFFFNVPETTKIYTLSLHVTLPTARPGA